MIMNQTQLEDCKLIANNILQFFPKNRPIIGVELGVKEGYLSSTFLSINTDLIMHSVDLWGSHESISETHDHDTNYNLAVSNLKKFDGRSIIHKMLTIDAIKKFDDNSLDFVYIDATHTYEAVKQEIELWSKKVKPDGLISGHDYVSGWPGVIKAVNESIIDLTKLQVFSHGVWAINNEFIKK